MSSKAMSLKARIRNYAKDNRIAAQVVLQNYMFECFWHVCRGQNFEINLSLKAVC